MAVIAFAAAYFWQKSKSDDSLAKLNVSTSKISQIEKQLAEKAKEEDKPIAVPQSTANSINADLIPGDTDTRRNDGRILITAIWKNSLDPTAVWIEYGTDPGNLIKSSTKLTKELGMGDGTYSRGSSVSINNSELEPGSTYYYRVAATIKGQTERSAVASFVTDK